MTDVRFAKAVIVWYGRVTDVEGDLFTALIWPIEANTGPELLVDFRTSTTGLSVEVGDLITVAPWGIAKVDLGVWTQEEIDEIGRKAKERAKLLKDNVDL